MYLVGFRVCGSRSRAKIEAILGGLWVASFRAYMSSILVGDTMVPNNTPLMDNQMEKNMENEMEAGII